MLTWGIAQAGIATQLSKTALSVSDGIASLRGCRTLQPGAGTGQSSLLLSAFVDAALPTDVRSLLAGSLLERPLSACLAAWRSTQLSCLLRTTSSPADADLKREHSLWGGSSDDGGGDSGGGGDRSHSAEEPFFISCAVRRGGGAHVETRASRRWHGRAVGLECSADRCRISSVGLRVCGSVAQLSLGHELRTGAMRVALVALRRDLPRWRAECAVTTRPVRPVIVGSPMGIICWQKASAPPCRAEDRQLLCMTAGFAVLPQGAMRAAVDQQRRLPLLLGGQRHYFCCVRARASFEWPGSWLVVIELFSSENNRTKR